MAFQWESDASWLGQLLVPDPLTPEAFGNFHSQWMRQGQRHEVSLAGFLIRSGALSEQHYLRQLSMATGLSAVPDAVWIDRTELDDHCDELLARGYRFFKDAAGNRYACGDVRDAGNGSLSGNESFNRIRLAVTAPDDPLAGERSPSLNTLSPASAENWLTGLIEGQIARGVHDLHFEKDGHGMSIRHGSRSGLKLLERTGSDHADTILRTLKRWAGLSTADNALPQDGRFALSGARHAVQIRMACLPTFDGESVVLRLLTSNQNSLTIDSLGLPDELRNAFAGLIEEGTGLMLCVGPTGSGKSTTMSRLLEAYSRPESKLMTIEDPVEYILPHATQSHVNPDSGWTFANAIKAFLRQDPDQIMVGEIRDPETAAIACRAALTGHLVFATMHAKCEVSTLDRLHAWGVSTGLITDTLRLIINQRLVYRQGSGRPEAKFGWLATDEEELARYFNEPGNPPVWRCHHPIGRLTVHAQLETKIL